MRSEHEKRREKIKLDFDDNNNNKLILEARKWN